MPTTAQDEDVNVSEVLPGMARLLLPKTAVTPLGNPFTDSKALLPAEPQAPGLPIVTVVAAVSTLGAIPISFTVAKAGAKARL